jgi:hypothetical protein
MKPLRRRLVRQIRQLSNNIAIARCWNDLHPDQRPLDCEIDRVALQMARRALVAWDAGSVQETSRLIGEMVRYIEAADAADAECIRPP